MRPVGAAALCYLWLLLGITLLLSTYRADSRALLSVSRTEEILRPLRPFEAPPPLITAPSSPMDEIMRCICGKNYTNESHFNSHQNKCPRVLNAARRSWDIADTRSKKKAKEVPTRRGAPGPARASSSRANRQPKEGRSRSDRTDRGEGTSAASSSWQNRYQLLAPPHDDPIPYYMASDDVDHSQAEPQMSDPPMPNPTPPSPPPIAEETLLPKRVRRPTAKALQALEDALPEGPGPLQEQDEEGAAGAELPARPEPLILRIPRIFRTAANSFRLSRIYRRKPSVIPDMDNTLNDRTASGLQATSSALSARTLRDIIWPYPNLSSWLFGKWFWNEGDKKTKSSRASLLDILLSGVFRVDDLRAVNFDKIDNVLGTTNTSEMEWEGNGWKTSTVTIKIPLGKKATKEMRRQKAADAQTARRYGLADPEADEVETHKFEIPGFHHRSLVHVMRSIIQFDDAAKAFHWHPYEQFWTPAAPWANPERVHDELYCSPAWNEADRKLQASPPEPG
ncbi:hypothetical protein FB451DRAFT_1569315, partial [Mycena latifolia]